MRTLTAREQHLLATGEGATHVKLEVERGASWIDLTAFGGHDWVQSVSYRENIDDPVMTLEAQLWRELGADGAGLVSLSPLVERSPLNRVSGSYSPAIDAGRRVRLWTAMVPSMDSPAAADWRLVFVGKIDSVDAGGDGIAISCRDQGGKLQDTYIEDDLGVYGSDAGTPVEAAMQALLDDTLGSGVVTLYTPASPGWNIHKYQQERAPLLDAVRALAQQIGWDVRYRWRASTSQFELTLYSPDRAKTTPDLVLGPSQYTVLPQVSLSMVNVRNVGVIEYTDRATNARAVYTTSDAASISRFGRRAILIGEASSSNIDSETEAKAMMDGIIDDLAAPAVEQSVEMPHLYAVGLGDLLRFEANGIHYDTDHDLAATTIDHSLTGGQCSTVLGLRGKPSAGYERWIALEQRAGQPAEAYCRTALQSDVSRSTAAISVPVPAGSVVTDRAALYRSATGDYEVSSPGLYEISASVAWSYDGTLAARCVSFFGVALGGVYISGTWHTHQAEAGTLETEIHSMQLSVVVRLRSGDVVCPVWTRGTSGPTDVIFRGNGGTAFSLRRLSL